MIYHYHDFQKGVKVGIKLKFMGMMFYWKGTNMEKGHFLGPSRWTSLTEGTRNIPYPPVLVGQVDVSDNLL